MKLNVLFSLLLQCTANCNIICVSCSDKTKQRACFYRCIENILWKGKWHNFYIITSSSALPVLFSLVLLYFVRLILSVSWIKSWFHRIYKPVLYFNSIFYIKETTAGLFLIPVFYWLICTPLIYFCFVFVLLQLFYFDITVDGFSLFKDPYKILGERARFYRNAHEDKKKLSTRCFPWFRKVISKKKLEIINVVCSKRIPKTDGDKACWLCFIDIGKRRIHILIRISMI